MVGAKAGAKGVQMSKGEAVMAGLIAALHRAALEPAAWRDVLLALERALSGARISVTGMDRGAGSVFTTVTGGFDPAFGQQYRDHYHALNPFAAALARVDRPGTRISAMDLPDQDLWRTEFYNDWMRPQDDLASGVGLISGAHGLRSLFLAVNLPRRARATLERPALTLLHALEPHVTHAFRVGETVAELAARPAGRMQPDGPQVGGVLITDASRMLIWADPGAMRWHGILFRLDRAGRLVFPQPAAQRWAQNLTPSALPGGAAPPDCRITVGDQIWRLRALPQLCDRVLSPLFPGGFLHGACPDRQLAFVLSRQQADKAAPELDADMARMRLIERYRLSPAEAEVALLIAQGRATAQIAQARQVSVHTVRNQVRAVLDKMQARHRGDITRLALRAE